MQDQHVYPSPSTSIPVDTSDGSGSKNFDPGRVNFLWLGLGQPFIIWVWIWKISPKNVKFFNFSLRSKKISSGRKVPGSTSYLLRVKSKLGSGQGLSLVDTADYYYPDWGCLFVFFCNQGLKNCCQLTHNLSSQSGALYLLATAILSPFPESSVKTLFSYWK